MCVHYILHGCLHRITISIDRDIICAITITSFERVGGNHNEIALTLYEYIVVVISMIII